MSLIVSEFKAKAEKRIVDQNQKYLSKVVGKEVQVEEDWNSFGEFTSEDDIIKKGFYLNQLEENV